VKRGREKISPLYSARHRRGIGYSVCS